MNHLFFSGGPLDRQNFDTCAPAGTVFSSNGAVYSLEQRFPWAGGRMIHCYRYVGRA